jgi:hypothetical protein
MLTAATIRQIQEREAQFGRNEGSCFGVLDASQLRQSTPIRRVVRAHAYTLIFLSAETGETVEQRFTANSQWTALVHMKATLGIARRLTEERFAQAGGVRLMLGEKQVYPRKRKPHPGGGK